MTEAPALLLIMLLAHVVLDFVLPLRRRLEQLSSRFWQMLSLGLGLRYGVDPRAAWAGSNKQSRLLPTRYE